MILFCDFEIYSNELFILISVYLKEIRNINQYIVLQYIRLSVFLSFGVFYLWTTLSQFSDKRSTPPPVSVA